jgi:hypothetical protein
LLSLEYTIVRQNVIAEAGTGTRDGKTYPSDGTYLLSHPALIAHTTDEQEFNKRGKKGNLKKNTSHVLSQPLPKKQELRSYCI